MKPSEIFAKNARARMADLDMDQGDVAAQMGVSRAMVSNYLSGKVNPGAKVMQAFADALKCSVSTLLGDSDTPTAPAEYRPTQEELVLAILENFDLEPKRKAICKLALSAEEELVNVMHDSLLSAYLEGSVNPTPNHQKPSVG